MNIKYNKIKDYNTKYFMNIGDHLKTCIWVSTARSMITETVAYSFKNDVNSLWMYNV